LDPGAGGYFSYATQSNAAPGNVVGGIPNQANYRDANGVYSLTQTSNFSLTQNYLADVGAYSSSASFYGTFDQTGSVWEWTDASDGSLRTLRGGVWDSVGGSSQQYIPFNPAATVGYDGFRLAGPVAVPEPSTWLLGLVGVLCGASGAWRQRKRTQRSYWFTAAVSCLAFLLTGLASARAVTIDWVTVGDPRNAADTNGYGAVNYEYRIGKYEVTIGQYVDFLNSVAKEDPKGLFHPYMVSEEETAGIRRTGISGAYTYSAVEPWGIVPAGADSANNRPIAWVTWFSAARFANWMSNGQPTGAQGPTTTENGAYDLVTAPPALAPAINALNPNTNAVPLYRIPTENEWYKAAFYKGGSANAGYWKYATQSNSAPGNVIGSGFNQVNCMVGLGVESIYCVTQAGFNINLQQNYLTNVGAFTGSPSFYGTFDQSGNVTEWNDLRGEEGLRGVRGGNYGSVDSFFATSSDFRNSFHGATQGVYGFRLASPAVVPEPSAFCMAFAGLTCGGYSMWRRRSRVSKK
jgi:formylglycine-generating enzyme required for sulfatase activity